jgi:CubicO group peptidase (beta-lactamase class C family)
MPRATCRPHSLPLLLFVGAAFVLPAASGVEAQAPRPTSEAVAVVVAELEPEIRRAMIEGQIPSVTIALTAGEEIVWSAGFGETNLRTRTPATPQSVYIIASTLKTMVATVVMQLVDEGHFGLDDPVVDHLGDLELPAHDPANPITLRHLLTHTSGLGGGFSSVPVWADTVPRNMDRFLREGLRVLGPPGEGVRYSNPAFTLMAHMIQVATGEDFQGEVRRRIWEPLGMRSTAFAPTPRMEEVLAVPYRPAEGSGSLEPLARTRFAEWPAGGAWGTVEDQARWIMASVNGGRIGDTVLLDPATAELMQTRQLDAFAGPMAGGWGGDEAGYGLAWWTTVRGGERHIAHSGSVGGYTAFIHGNPERGLGVALLTNGNRAHPHLVRLSFLATDLMAREGLGRPAGGR